MNVNASVPPGLLAFMDSELYDTGNFQDYSGLVGYGIALLYEDLLLSQKPDEPAHVLKEAEFKAPAIHESPKTDKLEKIKVLNNFKKIVDTWRNPGT